MFFQDFAQTFLLHKQNRVTYEPQEADSFVVHFQISFSECGQLKTMDR